MYEPPIRDGDSRESVRVTSGPSFARLRFDKVIAGFDALLVGVQRLREPCDALRPCAHQRLPRRPRRPLSPTPLSPMSRLSFFPESRERPNASILGRTHAEKSPSTPICRPGGLVQRTTVTTPPVAALQARAAFLAGAWSIAAAGC